MIKQRVLVLDIETTPITAYVWGLRDQNISLNQIVKDWSVMAWGAKWLGEKKVMYQDMRHAKHIENDREILLPLWNLLDEADIIITQNGQRFDGPKLNARFIMHGMKPPSPYKHLDTYRIVKRTTDFTSNKLEYLTDKLCTKYKKLHHQKFPGMSLWTECLKGNMKAWKEMQIYNTHDVLSTEELYNKIKAWAPETMPKPHVHLDYKSCKVCGAVDSIRSNGIRLNYRRLMCSKCGRWSKEKVK